VQNNLTTSADETGEAFKAKKARPEFKKNLRKT
jgi:hypothetical protein